MWGVYLNRGFQGGAVPKRLFGGFPVSRLLVGAYERHVIVLSEDHVGLTRK